MTNGFSYARLYKMKGPWVAILVVVIVLVGAYLYRGQIMSLFGGASSPTTTSYAPSYSAPNVSGPSTPTSTTMANVITWQKGTKGQYAVGSNGMTLYRFDKDTKGVSNCSGSCAGVWPPYTTASAPATLPANVTLITRGDGSMQFAYKGMPLYYYTGDQNVGDMTGDGFNGIWHIVTP